MERLNQLFRLSLLLFLPTALQARLGENSTEIADRYGSPKEYQDSLAGIAPPFLQGAYVRQYQKGDWVIIAAFLDVASPSVRVRYQKKRFTPLTGEEIAAILQANCFGMTWRPIVPASAGEAVLSPAFRLRRWKRDDGATAFLQDRTLQLDSPKVAEHEEQMKNRKLKKARQNRPEF